jgi:hypothetical protein
LSEEVTCHDRMFISTMKYLNTYVYIYLVLLSSMLRSTWALRALRFELDLICSSLGTRETRDYISSASETGCHWWMRGLGEAVGWIVWPLVRVVVARDCFGYAGLWSVDE